MEAPSGSQVTGDWSFTHPLGAWLRFRGRMGQLNGAVAMGMEIHEDRGKSKKPFTPRFLPDDWPDKIGREKIMILESGKVSLIVNGEVIPFDRIEVDFGKPFDPPQARIEFCEDCRENFLKGHHGHVTMRLLKYDERAVSSLQRTEDTLDGGIHTTPELSGGAESLPLEAGPDGQPKGQTGQSGDSKIEESDNAGNH